MKKLLFLAAAMSLAFGVSAQVRSEKNGHGTDKSPIVEEEQVWTVVEEDPEFPGGIDALGRYLSENIRYPQKAKENGLTGTVYLSFVVEKDGSVANVKVLRDVGGGCGAEAVRVVKAMPKWKPGRQQGKPVRVQYNLPIKFSLQ